jgi:acetyl-CoA acetyltransferase
MREVGIVAYAQSKQMKDAGANNEVELIMPVVHEVFEKTGLTQKEIDFTCSGSCDYLQGAPFAFVEGLNALSSVPSIKESHVEMDAAWAFYEAWLKIQTGEADICLIYGFGKSSPSKLPSVLALQLDPYYMAPIWPDAISLAAIQANIALREGTITEAEMADVVKRSRKNAQSNDKAQLSGDYTLEALLDEPAYVSPLRKHDCPPITDGASAIIIASKEKALELCEQPAFIKNIDHRIESGQFTTRDLARSVSTRIAAESLGILDTDFDVIELHAPFSHQELILRNALNITQHEKVNLSGGSLSGNTMMAAGLDRIGHVAKQIMGGHAQNGLAHATSGPCLQHNLLATLEA